MEYMLCFFETDAEVGRRDDPDQAPAYWGAWNAYVGALNGAGVVRSGNGLQPPRSGSTVRVVDGQRQVQAGPYADTREHLGGYFIVDLPSLDQALEWAARAPCAAAGHRGSAGAAAAAAVNDPAGWAEAERAARGAYGRLVAWLAWQWRDLAAAEDAMGQAFEAALTHWPRDGVPTRPEAWLLSTARRALLQAHRRQRLEQAPEVLALLEAEPLTEETAPAFPDRRLQLMCACGHPAVPAREHAPLMLQAVLGLDAQTIARAFLVAPATLAQRLVRAKARLREQGRTAAAFELPDADALPARLTAVLDAVYGAYTIGSDLASPAPESQDGLVEEALFLAKVLAQLCPAEPEALGLLALMLHNEARRPALF